MNLIVNGRPLTLEKTNRLFDLLEQLEIPPERPGIAIAINDDVLQRADWSSRTLVEGDRLEIIRAVQGG